MEKTAAQSEVRTRVERDSQGEVAVPEDRLWVLGDNRNSSRDSRFNQDQPGEGFVPLENVVGRAFLTTWPLSRFGLLDFHHEVFAGVPEPADQP